MLVPLSNEPRDYAWGSTTLIPELTGREPSGRPEAEVWLGDHPADPAETPDGRTLASVSLDKTLRIWRAPSFEEIDATEKNRIPKAPPP